MSVVEVGRVPANVDTRLSTRTFGREATRGSVDVHDFPHGHAEAVNGRDGRLYLGLGEFGGCGPV